VYTIKNTFSFLSQLHVLCHSMASSAPPCRMCDSGEAHPVFLYMISDRVASGGAYSYIGRSRHPSERLKSQNREEGYRVGAKSTKHRAGLLALEMIVGPVVSGEGETTLKAAKRLQAEWRSIGKKWTPRIQMGVQIGLKYEMEMFVVDKQLVAQVVISVDEGGAGASMNENENRNGLRFNDDDDDDEEEDEEAQTE
jgi:hypothetical protein